jgi:hypothetical protein
MLRALARARHEDLLNGHRTRGLPKVRLDKHLPGSRRRAGSVFIWAGARLLGKERGSLELTHQ